MLPIIIAINCLQSFCLKILNVNEVNQQELLAKFLGKDISRLDHVE